MDNVIGNTKSLCPKCLKILKAEIFKKYNKVWIKKKCPKHGNFEDLYYGDVDFFNKVLGFSHDGKGISNPKINKNKIICPKDCGLCNEHLSHTALGNIVLTNRCDLQCWYCFFYAKIMGYVYEPSLDQIRQMLKNMKNVKPVPAKAIQLTGGEPLLRENILDIIRIAKEEKYNHVQLNTNGIRLSKDLELVKKIRKAGVNTIYLSFDGVTPKTNPKNHWEVPYVLGNCRKIKMGIVLVPTIINNVNDHDVANILRFGLKNIDIVRGINFQPVSLVGRITKADVKKYRITIPDVIERLGEVGLEKADFFPIPTVAPLTHFIESVTGLPKYELSTHPVCGAATYVFKEDKKIIPLPRFVDVEGLMEYLEEKTNEIKSGKSKLWVTGKILYKLGSFVDKKKQPKNVNFAKIFYNILVNKNYKALRELHYKTLFIGMMHFMDLWNYDIERVNRCCIHYAQPDGRIVPFCAFNVIPQWYRDNIQKKYGNSIKKWEKITGKKLKNDFYKRHAKKLVSGKIYKKTYKGFV